MDDLHYEEYDPQGLCVPVVPFYMATQSNNRL